MGMEFEEGGTVLRVLYATLGKKPTRVVVWFVAIGAIVATSRWLIENVEWFVQKFGWTYFSWGNLLNAFVGAVLSMILLLGFAVAVAIFVAVIMRFAVDLSQRRKMEDLAKNLIEIMEQSKTTIANEQIDAMIYKAEKISYPPLVFRILDRILPRKKRREKT